MFATRSAAIRALSKYPRYSDIAADTSVSDNTIDDLESWTMSQGFPKSEREKFALFLAKEQPKLAEKLNQPFGKDTVSQCFSSEPTLRHVLLPVMKSGFLGSSLSPWRALAATASVFRDLVTLVLDYADIDFRPLRGYPVGWDAENTINYHRAAMTTAALLHFNGSAADTVRWVGGPHVAAHRDTDEILRTLRRSDVSPSVIADIARLYRFGAPNTCNASSTEANFQAYLQYGNHASASSAPDKAASALVKDNKKGYTLLFDPRLIPFLLNCHVTPQGLVDIDTPGKKPRPIFDSSFRPFPWCHAINDWTTPATEPPLTFAGAEMEFMIWLYNLRITYPTSEIYLGDDDVSGAFRQVHYHPNLVAMHTSVQCNLGVLNTGTTFGDNTSPSNWDPIKCARQQRSQFIWLWEAPSWLKARQHLPPLVLAPPLSHLDTVLAPADKDNLNQGVLFGDGTRKPPPFPMHVDDALYADVSEFLERTVCASAAGLFDVLGWPQPARVPIALSLDKLSTNYNHQRRLVGRLFDSRALTVGMLPCKRAELIANLQEWSTMQQFDLLQLAGLLGTLDNHTRYARWARCWFFGLQNAMRRCLNLRFHVLQRLRPQLSARASSIMFQLPPSLAHRLAPLMARERAAFLWTSRCSFQLSPESRTCIATLLHYVTASPNPWETHLALVVPRTPHFDSYGDASTSHGGGAFCTGLQFWFDIAWSPRVLSGCKLRPSAPGYVHINSLEFIVLLLQLAAVIVRLRTLTPAQRRQFFPSGVPAFPVWMGNADNTVSLSWESRATAKSPQGQGLLFVYSELLRTSGLHTCSQHVAGVANVCADDISRNDFSLPFSARLGQLLVRHPSLSTFDYFLPSPSLLRLLGSRLFSESPAVPIVLPKTLGVIVPAGSTTSSLPTL